MYYNYNNYSFKIKHKIKLWVKILNIGKKTKVFYTAVTAIFIVAVLILFIPKFIRRHEHDVGFIKEWTYVDSAEKDKITLPQKLYKDEEGYVKISTVLPEEFADAQTVCFWTFYKEVDVYVDGQPIYSYDNSTVSFGRASSSQWNYVGVPGGSQGKSLVIKTHTSYDDINMRLAEVVYGDAESVMCWLDGTFGFYHTLDSAIMWIGVLFVLLAFIQKVDYRHKVYQFCAGIILFLFSIYLRTGPKGLPVYWMSAYMREFMQFFCLSTISIPLTVYIKTRVIRKKKLVVWCDTLLVTEMVAATLIFIIHGVGLYDFHDMMIIPLLLLFISVLTGLIGCFYYFFKERARFSYLTTLSLLLIICMFIVEYLQFYQLGTLPFDTGFLSHLGAILVIGVEAISYIMYLNSESRKQQKVVEENKNLQIQMLTSQIRPHFILNTIGAIRNLIFDDAARASDLLYEFSKYIRNNLEQKDYTKPVPFPEELDYIETYLSLESARFGDRIKVEYDIETTNFWVMPLSIQPFVENAVKHGLAGEKEGGLLRISTRLNSNGRTVVRIEDNGVGFDPSLLDAVFEEKRSVGMRSAVMRLEKQMGAKVAILSSTTPGRSGTCVQIEL